MHSLIALSLQIGSKLEEKVSRDIWHRGVHEEGRHRNEETVPLRRG